jgi:2-desacetyl-2-hydroxyethyl bacteriochlorophyllide A dehydrogenase
MDLKTRVLEHTAPRKVQIRSRDLPDLGDNDILAKATCSGISPGTEALVFNGYIEPGTALDTSIPALKDGTLQYPFSYGYCWVGTVEQVGDKVDHLQPGDRIFTFAPHQLLIVTVASSCILLPAQLTDSAAALLPSMETALSIVHDAKPLLGEDIRIFGQGLIGLLTAWLLSKFPLNSLSAVDPCEHRRETSLALGITSVTAPGQTTGLPQADATIEASGNPEALEPAIQCTLPHGRVIVASWYGSKSAQLSLNTHFHRGRIQLISSQVSAIAPELRGRWTHERRMDQAIHMLGRFPHDTLSTQPIAFEQAPELYPPLFGEGFQSIHPYFEYPED